MHGRPRAGFHTFTTAGLLMAEQKATNVHWHAGDITRADRNRLLRQKGATIWFTGLSGSGKSTIAVALESALYERGHLAFRLDGDNVRLGINKNLGFSAEDRKENIRRIGEVAKLFVDAGVIVLSSFISPYREDRDVVRKLHADAGMDFFEVFVDCPLDEAEKRDPKGLYRKARAGQIKNFTGIDDPYEAPLAAELTLRTDQLTLAGEVEVLLDALEARGILRPTLIAPHGGGELNPLYVYDEVRRAALEREAASLPALLLNSAAAANAVMLGAGYFSPLTGYMNRADALAVADRLHTTSGLFWPVPIVNLARDVSAIAGAKRIALRDPNVDGQPVIAIMNVEAIETLGQAEIEHMARKIFGTLDPEHPGVGTFLGLGRELVSGPIEVLNFSYFQSEFPDTFRTAVEIREDIAARGWHRVVAFQTRNPMHRAHEELCRMAQQQLGADGIVIHMLLGRVKEGDIPAAVRDACIRTMAEVYFPPNSVMVTGYGFDMLYAGPREAVLHAIFRQNMGATHLIVGRDHAGVGGYYGPFDAQTIFDTDVPPGALAIQIFRADNTAYSKKLGRVVMMRDAPDHGPEDFINLSGTKVREMLGNGVAPPPEFSRPEVAKILMRYYQGLN
jgi:sulfate adenylyltransferase